MKRFYCLSSILSVIFFCLLNNTSYAQFPGMQKVYADFDARNRQMMSNMMMNSMMMRSWYNTELSEKQDFTLLMKDSSKVAVSSKIYTDTTAHKNYLLLVDKSYARKDPRRETKIYADQTLKISRTQEFINVPGEKPTRVETSGFANDSCWLFKAVTGKINAYSYLSVSDQYSAGIVPQVICAIQVDNGPIVGLNEANFTPMVGRNEYVLALIRQKKYYQAIKQYNKDFAKANKK